MIKGNNQNRRIKEGCRVGKKMGINANDVKEGKIV